MKIHAKIEDGRPLLVFPDEISADKMIGCYSPSEGHCLAARSYLRSLQYPKTAAENLACKKAIHEYTA